MDRFLHVHFSHEQFETSISHIRDHGDYEKWQSEAPQSDKAQGIFWPNIPTQIRTEGTENKIFYKAPVKN